MVIRLEDFTLTGVYPYTPYMGKSVETGTELSGIFESLKIKVPGSIYDCLEQNNIIRDVRIGMQSLESEWVANKWWIYDTAFELERLYDYMSLHFGGVDYSCRVYLNGYEIGEHIGATASFEFDIAKYAVIGKNKLRVLVIPAPEDMGQIGYTYKVFTQRPRFDFKWDFCTRVVNVGIYRPVKVNCTDHARLGTVLVDTDSEGNLKTRIECAVNRNCKLHLALYDASGTIVLSDETAVVKNGSVQRCFTVKNVRLWYPNGLGEPYLYRLRIQLTGDGAVYDSAEQTVGFRSLALLQNPGAPDGALPYTFEVNGQRMFVKGFNLTPLDLRMGTETAGRYEMLVSAAQEANANLIRVWGGGVIEQPIFYELCSKYGILIWQDMIQSSSGLSNEPSCEPKYLDLLSETVRYAAQMCPNYPSFGVFCGGNELFGSDGRPITLEHLNIRRIKSEIERIRPGCFLFPSTSTGPTQEPSLEHPDLNHDIHGPWLYLGNEAEYSHYNRLQCLFAAEFGSQSLASVEQLRQILPKEDFAVLNTQNYTWKHHGEFWDVSYVVEEVFGKLGSLEDQVFASQFLQANGLEYAIGSHRCRCPKESGCIVWQLNENWPNVGCTSVIEYYGNKKLCFEHIKRAYAPIHTVFKFDKLAWAENENIRIECVCVGDVALQGSYKIEILKDGVTDKTVGGAIRGETATAFFVGKIAARNAKTICVRSEIIQGGEIYRDFVVFPVLNKKGVCDISALRKCYSDQIRFAKSDA